MRTYVVGVALLAELLGCSGTQTAPAVGSSVADAGSRGMDGSVAAIDAGAGGGDAGTAETGGTGWCVPPLASSEPDQPEPGLSNDCTGLAPPLPLVSAATDITFSTGTHGGSIGATSDGQGDVAVVSVDDLGGFEYSTDVRSTAGVLLYTGGGSAVAPQPQGFAVLEQRGPLGLQGLGFRFLPAPDPAVPWLVLNQAVWLAGDPLGGALVVEAPFNALRTWLTAHRFDGTGSALGPPADLYSAQAGQGLGPVAMAIGTAGEGLVSFVGADADAGMLLGRWVDATGQPASAVFALGPTSPGRTLRARALLDGSIALQQGDAWTLRIRRMAATPEPAPQWLVSVGASDFVVMPRNRGYLVPSPAVPTPLCTPVVDVRAPAGNLCARIGVNDPRLSGTRAYVGADGTLILQGTGGNVRPPGCDFGVCNEFRWWTGMFRAPEPR